MHPLIIQCSISATCADSTLARFASCCNHFFDIREQGRGKCGSLFQILYNLLVTVEYPLHSAIGAVTMYHCKVVCSHVFPLHYLLQLFLVVASTELHEQFAGSWSIVRLLVTTRVSDNGRSRCTTYSTGVISLIGCFFLSIKLQLWFVKQLSREYPMAKPRAGEAWELCSKEFR